VSDSLMPMDQTSNLLEQVYVPGLQTKKSETPRNDKAQGNRRSCSTKSSMIEQNTSKKAITPAQGHISN